MKRRLIGRAPSLGAALAIFECALAACSDAPASDGGGGAGAGTGGLESEGGGGASPCDCDDDNPCTDDVCDAEGACTHPLAVVPTISQSIGDCKALYCDGDTLGEQADTTDVPLDDGNECTTEACDGDVPVHPPERGTACDDGLFCTTTSSCNAAGDCVGSGNPCAGHDVGPSCDDSCNEVEDDCSAADASDTACDEDADRVSGACSGTLTEPNCIGD